MRKKREDQSWFAVTSSSHSPVSFLQINEVSDRATVMRSPLPGNSKFQSFVIILPASNDCELVVGL